MLFRSLYPAELRARAASHAGGADANGALAGSVLASLNESVLLLTPQAGLAAETRGDAALAEKWLQEAATVDRQYEPRWTLANFYFRQSQPTCKFANRAKKMR